LTDAGYTVETRIAFKSPKKAIPHYAKEIRADLLVLGSHGHRMFKDLILGTTISKVRHQLRIPVLVVSDP
jgi:manganese transport protein